MDHEKAVSGVVGVAVAVAKEVPVLGTAVKLTFAVRDGLLEDGSKRLEAYVQEEIRDAVFRRFPEIEQRVRALEEAGVDAKVSDFVHVTRSFGRAWTTAADPKKRERLEAAFVRSFDKHLYESGLLNTLWERLERLSYGDLYLLRSYLDKGLESGLLQVREHVSQPAMMDRFHAENLAREGLFLLPNPGFPKSSRPTALGHYLYELAWAQLPEPGAAAASDETGATP